MASGLAEFPPELILHVVSFLTREKTIDTENRLPNFSTTRKLELVPDLPSINALSQINVIFHHTVDQTLYDVCANVVPLGKLALLFAVEHELESAVDRLVAAGVSVDAEFIFEYVQCGLLQIAAARGLRDMVVKLLKMYGNDMAVRVHARNHNDKTALDYAVLGEHMEIVRLLAPIPTPASEDLSPLVVDGHETQEQYLGHALVELAEAVNLEICQYLILEGADVNFLGRNSYPGTPLWYAAGTRNLALVQLLLASGADPNLRTVYGSLPLFKASDINVLRALLVAGADIHATDSSSGSVLAYKSTNIELLRFFLEHGIDPNHEDDDGETPLHYICRDGTAELCEALVELLLQFGATTVEKADLTGFTPLDIAMRKGYSEVVKIFEPLVQSPELRSKIAAWWDEREAKNIP
ncbi:ankyrin repeat-containing domain protein [Mycena galopus ATCC 62051]|nr:ankyrin repeat-containing domain protein [Mycena galopus ATCC 62051]